jgi:hypothetical protein
MTSQIIVIDLYSVFANLSEPGRNMRGIPVSGLRQYVEHEQELGSTIFFICGNAHDPFARQSIEAFLERNGLHSVFVTHGLPDGFNIFISTKAFRFHGEHFPVSTVD